MRRKLSLIGRMAAQKRAHVVGSMRLTGLKRLLVPIGLKRLVRLRPISKDGRGNEAG